MTFVQWISTLQAANPTVTLKRSRAFQLAAFAGPLRLAVNLRMHKASLPNSGLLSLDPKSLARLGFRQFA